MEKEILIVKNNINEGPGMLEGILLQRAIKYTIIDLDKGQLIPPVEEYTAMVVLGGPDSANDNNEKMRHELAAIKKCIQLKKPYLGICLGLQTLVKAAGGQVVKSPVIHWVKLPLVWTTIVATIFPGDYRSARARVATLAVRLWRGLGCARADRDDRSIYGNSRAGHHRAQWCADGVYDGAGVSDKRLGFPRVRS